MRRRSSVGGRRLLVALFLFFVLTPSAQAARGLEIAAQDEEQFLSDQPESRAAAFGHARALGISSIRATIAWSRIVSEPRSRTKPAQLLYDWSRHDRLVDEAAASGIRVQLSLAGPAPAWATGNKRAGVTRISPTRFAEFAAAAARHFNGRVRSLSIWNEPNWHGLLKTERICGKVTRVKKVKGKKRKVRKRVCVKTSARRYRDLYRASYQAIKRAAPRMPVWIGETNPYVNKRKQSTAPLKYLRQMLCLDPVVKRCRGGRLRADGYAHHPYDFARAPNKKRKSPDEVTLANIGKLSKFLKKHRKRMAIKRNSLYLTEFAYYSSGPNAQPEKRRSKWTKQAFDIALKAPGVRQLLYYQVVDPARSKVFRTGLVRLDGSKHPVYNSLQAFYNARKSRLTRPRAPFTLPPPPFGR